MYDDWRQFEENFYLFFFFRKKDLILSKNNDTRV